MTKTIYVNLNTAIEAMKQTDNMKMTDELPIVREWLMDTIERLTTPESFEKWIDTDDYSQLVAK